MRRAAVCLSVVDFIMDTSRVICEKYLAKSFKDVYKLHL